MKKILLFFCFTLFLLIIAYLLFSQAPILFQNNSEVQEESTSQSWYTIENIVIGQENGDAYLQGNCEDGPYIGEVVVFFSDDLSPEGMQDGDTVRVLAGPGMTRSLPAQLMGCSKIEIIKE